MLKNALIFAAICLCAYSSLLSKELVAVEKFSDKIFVTPGDKTYLPIQINIEKKWHIYWQNAGDSGLPTTISLELPTGLKQGETLYQPPEKSYFSDMADYVYSGSTILLVEIIADKSFSSYGEEASAKIKWLVCSDICKPGSALVKFKIAGKGETPPTQYTALLEKAKSTLAQAYPSRPAISIEKDMMTIKIKANQPDIKEIEFYPAAEGYIINGKKQEFSVNSDELKLLVPLDEMRPSLPEKIEGILAIKLKNVKNKYYFISEKYKQ